MAWQEASITPRLPRGFIGSSEQCDVCQFDRQRGVSIPQASTTVIRMLKNRHLFGKSPGGAPGVEHHEIVALPSGSEKVRITCADYSPNDVMMREIDDLGDFLRHHCPDWSMVRCINVDGLS